MSWCSTRPELYAPGVFSGSPAIGRDQVLADLRGRLERARIVCVVGPPGVGKSTVAAALVTDLPSTWCDCDRVTSVAGVERVLSAALGVPLLSGSSASSTAETLGRALAATGPVCITLDGVDSVATEISDLLQGLGRSAPKPASS